MRPADARLRLQDSCGRQDRRARRGARRDHQDARRRGAQTRRDDASDRRRGEALGRCGRDGRRRQRDRAWHEPRADRKRALRTRLHEVHGHEARPRDGVVVPLHPRSGQGSRRLGKPPCVPSAAEVWQGRDREGRGGRGQPRAAAECGCHPRLRARPPPNRHSRWQRRDGVHPEPPRSGAAREGSVRRQANSCVRHPQLALGSHA